MAVEEKDLFRIGEIIKVHGVKGKQVLAFTDDAFMRAHADYLFLRMDGLPVPFSLKNCSPMGAGRALVQFGGIESAEVAARLVGAEVLFEYSKVPERVDEPLEWSFLDGFKVFGEAEGLIGSVVAVDAQSANVILQVKSQDGREVLLPFHPELVTELNEKQRILRMNLPEGLLSLYE